MPTHFNCECGSKVLHKGKARHLQTKRHKDHIEWQNGDEDMYDTVDYSDVPKDLVVQIMMSKISEMDLREAWEFKHSVHEE